MGPKVRFLHTADIHLGRPLNSGGQKPPPSLADLFRGAGYRALKSIVDQALKHEVDFILIAGDLYDQEARSVKASRFLLEQCQRLEKKDIAVYIIAGNHDFRGRKREPFTLPENVFILGSKEVETEEFTSPGGQVGARIMGQSYRSRFESRKMYSYYTAPDRASLNLGLLHTQLDPQNKNYVPVKKSDLRAKEDIHYWALGHIHEPQILNRKLPAVVFSGTPQGRDVGETGLKGCFLVEMDTTNKPDIKFLPTSPVVFRKIFVDINSSSGRKPQNLSDLEELLYDKAETILKEDPRETVNFFEQDKAKILLPEGGSPVQGYIVRWVVKGRGPVHDLIAENRTEVTAEIISGLNDMFAEQDPFLWTHSLLFHTGQQLPGIDELQESNQLYKEIAGVVEDALQDEELKKELLASWGRIWEGSSDHEAGDPDKFYPDQETVEDLLAEAQQKIIGELFAEGEEE
ncbi:MAG: metallophosphoesterase family protein [Bacillota bacterium]